MAEATFTETLIQTTNPPFDSLKTAREFITTIQDFIKWNSVGLLIDDDGKNFIILLLENNTAISSLRANLDENDLLQFIIGLSNKQSKKIILRAWQGNTISSFHLNNLKELEDIWSKSTHQAKEFNKIDDIRNFIKRYFKPVKKIGRGNPFTAETKRHVMQDSHGRCMFTGCGDRLDIEQLTGMKGNTGYLAHNVASSERGERGIPYLSEVLSDDPTNVLLLCDKHHRLIDKIAASDYSAQQLSEMRKSYCDLANTLLDALAFSPIPVYSILWSVNSNVVGHPEPKEIALCLSPLQHRMDGYLQRLCDSNTIYMKNPDQFSKQLVMIIQNEADKIIQQTSLYGHCAAIFAFGPMPALIGLGALLGNKSKFFPMLRDREANKWGWPNASAADQSYEIIGIETLQKGPDVVLCVNFTAIIDKIKNKALELKTELNADIVEINALEAYLGSKAVPHPHNISKFTTELQKLFHLLKDKHGVKRVHLLIAAPNAACIALGQAIDLHHPDIIIYDFAQDTMLPNLIIRNDSRGNHLELP
ncbi:SAVED domain-containing protein [Acinetobacter baumannii]|uniref:SAVED domain-containing protein n=1 Tax=Acinetobacter baumannii TaxID=470 RepID=UPI00234236F4|nr:SAVED domain-containing protein [Acinetobacter baumannii]